MAQDVLLKDVRESLARLADEQLRPLLSALEKKLEPYSTVIEEDQTMILMKVSQLLLRLQWRSQDALSEFAGFYSLRLVLDHQSPLATYFIDLFCHLEWLLDEIGSLLRQTWLPELQFLQKLVRPVAETCRLVYVAYMILPRSEEQHRLWRDEVKLRGRHGRHFSRNQMHCRIRELGLTNLDLPGGSMIRLTEILGEGTSAKVYKGVFEAHHGNACKKIIGRPVAVKMFSSHVDGNCNFDMDEQLRDEQLRDELHRLVSVKHPNIVTPIGYIGKRPEGDAGLVMELMDGSLHDYLEMVNNKSTPPLQELDMLDLMLEIAKGMRFLHECDVIHRDLKPQNVLLRFCADDVEDLGCKLFEVKLAGFGLSMLLDHVDEGESVSWHTMFQGTSCYMAPEMRVNSIYAELAFPEKLDVFSFGTTCFNILIGNPDARAFCKTMEPSMKL